MRLSWQAWQSLPSWNSIFRPDLEGHMSPGSGPCGFDANGAIDEKILHAQLHHKEDNCLSSGPP